MPSLTTSPLSSAGTRIPVRTIAVEVVSGPDAGVRAEADSERLTVGTANGNVLVLTDPTVSRFHLELARDQSGIVVTDLESTNGTKVGSIQLSRGVVSPGTTLQLGRTSLKVFDGGGTTVEMHGSDQLCDLLGTTPVMRRLMAQVDRIAKTNVPVLLIGESGTGKELIARALHVESPRASKPMVVVDCGALAPGVVASELFGHERGAFTGAERTHVGAFERADGGTLFLDEVGELPPSLQPQLLGALERRRFRRVGGKTDISVDVRVVSATNRDLRAEVNAGTFRLDLYYRLGVVEVRIPPLRERMDDLVLLIDEFLKACGYDRPLDSIVTPEVMETLRAHRWPGNVRELRNWVEATVAMGEAPELVGVSSAPHDAGDAEAYLELPYKEARNTVLDRFEQRYLEHLTTTSGGNVSAAARRARMDRSYLIKLLQRHGFKNLRSSLAPEDD